MTPSRTAKRALLTVGIVAGFLAAAPIAGAQAPTRYVIPGARVFPEGVAVRPGTNDFFVTSTTDGTVFRGSTDRPRVRAFLPGGRDGRSASVGIKASRAGRLYVAGGATGRMYVYDARSGALIRAYDTNLRAPDSFVNDVALTPSGAYFTDSRRPVLYRVPLAPSPGPQAEPEVFLDLSGGPVQYGQGNNFNGIAPAAGGRYLVAVQSNTGRLFRIVPGIRAVTEIPLGGVRLTNGDGILIVGRTLYVMRNRQEQLVKVAMSPDFSSGRVLGGVTNRAFRFPTTLAPVPGGLLVVNAQFDARNEMRPPNLPFTISRIRRP